MEGCAANFGRRNPHRPLYALWCNYVRIHKTLRTSPAMAARIETRLWSMGDVVKLLERRENFRLAGSWLVRIRVNRYR